MAIGIVLIVGIVYILKRSFGPKIKKKYFN